MNLTNSINPSENLIKQLRYVCSGLSSTDFTECWKAFDTNDDGFIKGRELKDFVKTIVTLVNKKKPRRGELNSLTGEFLEEYDLNHDGKIDIGELAQILQPEENFFLLIRHDLPLLTSLDFIKAWKSIAEEKHYIGSKELKELLRLLYKFQNRQVNEISLDTYSKNLMDLYDRNGDGSVTFHEISKIVPPQENFMLKYKNGYNLDFGTFEKVFTHYDKDGDSLLKGKELLAFVWDLLETLDVPKAEKEEEYEKFKKIMLKLCDKNRDEILQKDELILWFGVKS